MIRVLLVEDDFDLRSILRTLVESYCPGTEVSAVASFDELLKQPKQKLSFHLAILDINLGYNRPSGLDVFFWLKEHQLAKETVFLTGHASNDPLVREAHSIDDVTVYQKPMDINLLIQKIGELKNELGSTPV